MPQNSIKVYLTKIYSNFIFNKHCYCSETEKSRQTSMINANKSDNVVLYSNTSKPPLVHF